MSTYSTRSGGADGGAVAHAATTGQTTDDHHAKLHAATHVTGQPDALTAANIGAAAASHAHAESDVTSLVSDLSGKAASAHTHVEADTTSLVADLAAKAASVHTHAESSVTNLVADLAAKSATGHVHAEADTTSLVSDLASKAASVHTHAEADTTNLVTDLAGKSSTSHTHTHAATTGQTTDDHHAKSHIHDGIDGSGTATATGKTTPGSTVLATGGFMLQYVRLTLAGSDRLTLVGTAEMVVDDFNMQAAEVILGSPKTPSASFVIPTEYFLDQIGRLSLAGAQRATLRGTADLILTDDFGQRSRIVLAGRG